ncbi:MAG: PKD domain-containing protein [Candidatus Woesearchaeota archaeon]
MYKKFLILFLLLINIGVASAALSWGEWTLNNNEYISISNGQLSEFEYAVTAISNFQGVQGSYSVWLFREGNNNPIRTYFSNQLTPTGVAGGFINVTPSDYQNQEGDYQVKIYANDYSGAFTYTIFLHVTPAQNPLSVACNANPVTGNAPLTTTFTATPSGGSGYYTNYAWNFGDGNSQNTQSNTNTHTYNVANTYYSSVTVTDSQNNVASADCGAIIVNAEELELDVSYINCFDTVVKGNNQSCQVFVKDNNNNPVGNADVDIYFIDGSYFGSCLTNGLSGGCTAYKTMNSVGRFTVYATAQKQGYISDLDTWPRKTFDVYDHRYDIINLDTYNDSNFYYQDEVFYRGEALYVKFQIYDTFTHTFVTEDVVTDSSLVSPPGGRADLTKMNFNDNWYYYKLDQIPLTHDFLGASNVFAFAFNFSEQTGGQAQTDLMILNNVPFVSPLPEITVEENEQITLDLYNYGYDLEDARNLEWELGEGNIYSHSTIDYSNNHPILTVEGINVGTGYQWFRVYDLDEDFAIARMTINVIESTQNNTIMLSCFANPTSGYNPLTVNFDALVTGGTGGYNYEWYFGNGQTTTTINDETQYIYTVTGLYNPSVTVTDNSGNTATAQCPQITVTNNQLPTITGVCNVDPQSGYIPLETTLAVDAIGGSGTYTSYQWMFGDYETQTTTYNSIMHTYESQGIYIPQVRVTDNLGNAGIISCPIITVLYTPITEFNATCRASPTSGVSSLTTTFNADVNIPGDYEYIWMFDDGQSSSGTQNMIQHTYGVGTYNPTLTISDGEHSMTVQCPRINVDEEPPALQLRCTASPTSGDEPLNVRFRAETGNPFGGSGGSIISNIKNTITNAFRNNGMQDDVIDAAGFVKYEFIFGDGEEIMTSDNQVMHTYYSGAYAPLLKGYTEDGEVITAICPFISVQSSGSLLDANPGGPYRGFTNEPLTFDASSSIGEIVSYEWDFGDGETVRTTSPLVDHTYVNRIGTFNVKLTVYDSLGNSDSASTTAVIVERTNYLPPRERVDEGLWVGRILINGYEGIQEVARTNDELYVNVELSNEHDYDLDDARIIIEIPELGIKQKSSAFDLRTGQEKGQSITVPLWNIPEGRYDVKIIIQDDNVRRVKYRELLISDTY